VTSTGQDLVERREVRAMTTMWAQPAGVLIEQADPGWEGIWALTFAVGHAAINLSLAVPLGLSVELTYAAMDFRDAQDELEWARPSLRATATAVRLGHVRDVDDAVEARVILDRLAAAALDRAAALAEVELDLSDQAALSRVMARLITGRAKVTGRWA